MTSNLKLLRLLSNHPDIIATVVMAIAALLATIADLVLHPALYLA
jgi:hypothetical protein